METTTTPCETNQNRLAAEELYNSLTPLEKLQLLAAFQVLKLPESYPGTNADDARAVVFELTGYPVTRSFRKNYDGRKHGYGLVNHLAWLVAS